MRPHYLRTYSNPGDRLHFTWRGRALALLACAALLSCLGGCGGGADLPCDDGTEMDTPAPRDPCTLNPKACT